MRPAVLALGLVAASILAPAPARAGVASAVVDGVLTVTGTGGVDLIQVRCQGGEVTVNGEAPATGPAACADLVRVVVKAGGGGDTVSLDALLPGDLPGLRTARVAGGPGDDRLWGWAGDDVLLGGGGGDVFGLTGGSDRFDGGSGRDGVRFAGGGDVTLTDASLETAGTVVALSRVEVVGFTSDSRDGVRFDAGGFAGDTFVNTGRGDDRVIGGSGRDSVSGGAGADRIVGGDGEDVLSGDEGRDTLLGGTGADRIDGGGGADRCSGGPGDDLVHGCES